MGLIQGLAAVCVQLYLNLYLPSVLGAALQGLHTEGWIFTSLSFKAGPQLQFWSPSYRGAKRLNVCVPLKFRC